jgi:hypothetical protein
LNRAVFLENVWNPSEPGLFRRPYSFERVLIASNINRHVIVILSEGPLTE